MSLAGLSISGTVLEAGSPDWDSARAAWNLAADQHPAAVALVQSAEDVAQAVRFAADHELKVAAQGTGHGAAPLAALEDTVLIKTERMRGVEVDRERQTARLEAGVLALELGEAAQQAGLCSLPGSAPDVGVVGFTLGGGLGWLGRRYGFACNRVSAIELVTAQGEIKRVDAEDDGDLFWALRGGGGSYAIVTALHVKLLPISELYAGTLVFPAELGAEAIRAYRDWAATVSEEVSSVVRFLRPPPLPEVPEPIRDKPLLTIGAACIGPQEQGERLIAPLRELGEPIMDIFGQIPAVGLSKIHMDPEQPVPGIGHHATIRELPDEAIEAFAGAAGPQAGASLLLAELRHLRGELGRDHPDAGALSSLDADFVMFGLGVPMGPATPEGINADLDRLHTALQPWAGAGGYFNFAERPCDVEAILPAAVCQRLGEIKRRWDPNGLIRANHALAVTA
jgi:FAD binding domain